MLFIYLGQLLQIHRLHKLLEYNGLLVECGLSDKEPDGRVRYHCRLLDGSNRLVTLNSGNLTAVVTQKPIDLKEGKKLISEGQDYFHQACIATIDEQIDLVLKAQNRFQLATIHYFGSALAHVALADTFIFFEDFESASIALKRACANCKTIELPEYRFLYANCLGIFLCHFI